MLTVQDKDTHTMKFKNLKIGEQFRFDFDEYPSFKTPYQKLSARMYVDVDLTGLSKTELQERGLPYHIGSINCKVEKA